MKLQCPVCGAFIDGDSVNVAADIAKCNECGELFKMSDLVERSDLEGALEQPKGSRITFSIHEDGLGVFRIPRRRISVGDLGAMGFAGFWLAFIAFWTWGAAHGSVVFALFSIPFWIVGIGMWVGILNGVLERQTIELTADGLRIHKIRPLLPRRYSIPYADIESVSMEDIVPRDPLTAMKHMPRLVKSSQGMGPISVPGVTHGIKKTTFAETVSEAEMRWLVAVIKAAVQSRGQVSGPRW